VKTENQLSKEKQKLNQQTLKDRENPHPSFNCQGMIDPIKRILITDWIMEQNIDITLLQETSAKSNEKESKQNHVWHFSSNFKQNPAK